MDEDTKSKAVKDREENINRGTEINKRNYNSHHFENLFI